MWLGRYSQYEVQLNEQIQLTPGRKRLTTVSPYHRITVS